MELARRSGVTVYAIGLQVPWEHSDERALLTRLAEGTGGRAFFADDVDDVVSAYRQIEGEVRSRYVLEYESTHGAEARFRTVDVEATRPGTVVRTVRGYHP